MNAAHFNELENQRRQLVKRIVSLQAVKRKEDVLKLAHSGESSLAIRGDEWDRHTMLLPVKNGVVDLRTGKLRPGRPDDFIKTVAPTSFLGLNVPAPTWEKFIKDIFDGLEVLMEFVHRLLGYGISGMTNHHILPIFHGPKGRNGKGTFLEMLKFVLGDLAYKTRSEVLLASRFGPSRGAPDADTLAFRGKRLIWASETGEGHALDAARIKELSGGDTLNARAPYGKRPVEFTPSHLLILLTNNRPQAPAQDDALWERLLLIPFNIRFVDDPHGPNERRADHDLLEKLKNEAPGILAWLVKGCLVWQRAGLVPPDIVKAATNEYRHDEDEIAQFVDDVCDRSDEASVTAGRIYECYLRWYQDNGMISGKAQSLKKLSRRLVDMGYRRDAEGRHTFFYGIGLKAA